MTDSLKIFFCCLSLVSIFLSLNTLSEDKGQENAKPDLNLDQLQKVMEGVDLQKLSEEIKKIDIKKIEKELKKIDTRKLEKQIQDLNLKEHIKKTQELGKSFADQMDLKASADAIEAFGVASLAKGSDPGWMTLAAKLAMPKTKKMFKRLTDTNWKLFMMSQIVFVLLLTVSASALKPTPHFLGRLGRGFGFLFTFAVGSFIVIPLIFLKGDYFQLASLAGDFFAISKKIVMSQ